MIKLEKIKNETRWKTKRDEKWDKTKNRHDEECMQNLLSDELHGESISYIYWIEVQESLDYWDLCVSYFCCGKEISR